MTKGLDTPRAEGQLVWCPADPSMGIGVVTEVEGSRIRVRFLRLQEERAYTTRGESVLARYEIRPGERVRVRDDQRETRVRSRLDGAGQELAIYELEDGTEVPESRLEPDVRDIGAKERLATLSLAHPDAVRARIQGLSASAIGTRPGVAAILGARVQWLPHQIDVATRAIGRDPVRMLLADEVGLGKTVEAALIYAGLRQEGRANRVLILTPDSLAIQWLGEIYRKTHELLVLLDDERIDDALVDFPDLSPFEAYQRIVASIDRVAADADLAAQAAEADWDLVVVDEAHHLKWRPEGGGNAAYKLVEALSHKSRHLLLLTATPMALDPTEYHALLRLLDPARFDDPRSFESTSERAATIRDVARDIAKAVEAKKPIPKGAEKAALELLDDDPEDTAQLKELVKKKPADAERKRQSDAVLEAMRARHGLADYVVRNRRGPVGGLPERKPQIFPLEPTELQSHLIDVGENVMFELARDIEDAKGRAATLGQMLRALWATPRALTDILKPISSELVTELAPHIGRVIGAPLDSEGLPTGDARLRWLVRLVRRLGPSDKLLVFVETAVAVRALKDALEPVLGSDIAMFHRALPPRDQDRQVAWFRDPSGPQLMLSTEAGGEGRNFQFCHRVVLYDLPWRPATVEQRIGRVDRVGQVNDVHVLVPYFKGGYEAAVLKIMQESIGVLDRTVGGIDHALEYVSDRIADLILDGAPSDEWKNLYLATEKLIGETRARIEEAVDPILDHSSFSPERVRHILAAIPEDIEEKSEVFVRGYAGHTKLELHNQGAHLVGVDGAPGATGSTTEYVATFSRTYALDHEDVEFLSFGHPLVEQAREWASQDHDASAALAICRGFEQDGAVFIYSFGLDLPDDVPEAAAYFEHPFYTFAVDEAGKRHEKLERLLEDEERALDRMDPTPLKNAIGRWRRLVDATHEKAEALANETSQASIAAALERLAASFAGRERDLARQRSRELARIGPKGKGRKAAEMAHAEAAAQLAADKERISNAIRFARPRLHAAVAVRLMKAKAVSA